MRSDITFLEAAQAARRIADKNGVDVADVFHKFKHGVRKSELSYTDFFWGKGDISPGIKKVSASGSRSRSAVAV